LWEPIVVAAPAAEHMAAALADVRRRVTAVLGDREPMPAVRLIDADLPTFLAAALTERDWRLIRFALARAAESL
jgi:hypothetical protein